MTRPSRSRARSLSDEEKKKRRREQKKMSMRRAREKLDDAALEERRRKDRERYARKKQDGLIKTIKDFTPREQRQIRKIWRQKSKLRREREKLRKQSEENISSSNSLSSRSRVLQGRLSSAQNRRRLKAKNEYLCNRIKLLEKKLAKYRMRVSRLKKKKLQNNVEKIDVKEQIRNFFLDDENSRLTAGRKETITRRKIKMQIRLLNDTLLNLYKIFINKTGFQVSYETFRRCRPFWVIFPKAAKRNTCLCSIHTNNDYIAHALYHAKIISYSTATDVAKSLCCNNVLNVSCLERRCAQCSEKSVEFNLSNTNDTIIYYRWITKNVTVVIKGQEKQIKKTIKEMVTTSKQLLINIFRSNLLTFMQHLANIINQFRAIRHIKENLTPSDGLLHIDFSENYGYKYGTEIQSAHFGGSKGQLSLHTCVYYSTDSQPPQNIIKTTSICTVSQNLRHDPILICTHLKPVIEKIKLLTPDLKELHILSDGPSTQYRNKTMFHMIANYLSNITNAETITWHFSETGHGKGAPDGVGGCLKRTCDRAVANGRDIIDIDTFVDCSTNNCKGIAVIPIDDVCIPAIQNIADAVTVRPFKGTFKIHQISWSKTEPNLLHARRLSCIECAAHVKCPHFEIGQIPVQCIQSPRTSSRSASRVATPSPVNSSHGTASVSTVTGPRTPQLLESVNMETPSPEPASVRQPLTPRKRHNFANIYSDDSISNDENSPPPKTRKRRPGIFPDSDDDISPPKISRNRRGILVASDDENSRPRPNKRRPVISDNSGEEEKSPPKLAKQPAITGLHSDDSEYDIF